VRGIVRHTRPARAFIEGTWLVPTYRWEHGVPLSERHQGSPGLWLVPHPQPGLLRRQRAPNETDRGLYRAFCLLDTTDRQALKRFADSHGLLGDGRPGDHFTSRVRTRAHPFGASGMSQPRWRYAITLMRHVVELWDALNAFSSTLLHPLIPERVERIRDEYGDCAFYKAAPELVALENPEESTNWSTG
jgi:hypothetical protein